MALATQHPVLQASRPAFNYICKLVYMNTGSCKCTGLASNSACSCTTQTLQPFKLCSRKRLQPLRLCKTSKLGRCKTATTRTLQLGWSPKHLSMARLSMSHQGQQNHHLQLGWPPFVTRRLEACVIISVRAWAWAIIALLAHVEASARRARQTVMTAQS